jgi:hypothetical protein
MTRKASGAQARDESPGRLRPQEHSRETGGYVPWEYTPVEYSRGARGKSSACNRSTTRGLTRGPSSQGGARTAISCASILPRDIAIGQHAEAATRVTLRCGFRLSDRSSAAGSRKAKRADHRIYPRTRGRGLKNAGSCLRVIRNCTPVRDRCGKDVSNLVRSATPAGRTATRPAASSNPRGLDSFSPGTYATHESQPLKRTALER